VEEIFAFFAFFISSIYFNEVTIWPAAGHSLSNTKWPPT
jgi:hypothetical protein